MSTKTEAMKMFDKEKVDTECAWTFYRKVFLIYITCND